MTENQKAKRYQRLYDQISGLMEQSTSPRARMATILAVLHHKMEYFFWTGFYFVEEGEMTVQQYQGPLACQVLVKDQGVCWAAYNQQQSIVVPNVHEFPGHIACDSRSNSEIVVPVFNHQNQIVGVLDVDSQNLNSFTETDRIWLEKIVHLIFV